MSFNSGLSYAKISVSASVTVSEKWKASVSAQNFAIAPKDMPVEDILASDWPKWWQSGYNRTKQKAR